MLIPAEEVYQALACLYDTAALAEVPLIQHFPQVAGDADAFTRAQRLRTILMEGIELLQPSHPASFRSPDARSYEVLALRFIEGLSMVQIAEELHVSRRQVYRDLAHAVEGLTKLLASYPRPVAGQGSSYEPKQPGEVMDDPFADELRRLSAQPAAVELARVVELALQTVRPMAAQWNVALRQQMICGPATVFASEPFLRLLLVNTLSAAIRCAASPEVTLTVTAEADNAEVSMEFRSRRGLDDNAFLDSRGLAEAQRLAWREEMLADGRLRLSVQLPTKQRQLVLVVEDNPGMIDLYRRYLAGSDEWQLVEARDPRLAFELARRLHPAVIILDILMPEQDGWTVLQVLRAQPETAHIPLLICSVFDELDLAAALGATVYLKKPVSQFQFLAALQRCLES